MCLPSIAWKSGVALRGNGKMYKQPSIHVVIWQIISIHRSAWCESCMCERLKCTCVFLGYLRVGWMTTTTAATLLNACAFPCVWRLCRCFCSICICGWSASLRRLVYFCCWQWFCLVFGTIRLRFQANIVTFCRWNTLSVLFECFSSQILSSIEATAVADTEFSLRFKNVST